jgi:shikimate kinase
MPRGFHHVRTDKIYLVGFMGAGKSTVSRALGSHLGWRVEDLDELVEAHEHRSIADLFAREGEAYFRVAEQGALRKLLDERHLIVATGGGTFVDPGNQSLINDDGASIWLDVSFEQVIDRLPSDGRRPLAADRTSMHALFEARQSAYAFAHLRLDASRAPVGELVERILEWLGA